MRSSLSALVLAALSAALPAQTCATLSVTGSGLPGTDLQFAYRGNARARAVLVIGLEPGSTAIRYGSLGTLMLGLEPPFLPVPLGRTDSGGNGSISIGVPTLVPPLDLFAQAFDFRFSLFPPRLDLCTSDVVPFHIGL